VKFACKFMAVMYKYEYFACSLRLPVSPVTPYIPEDGNEIFSRIAGETARGTLMFRFSKPETPRAALFVFLRNGTRAKSGFVSYASISLCFDFELMKNGPFPRKFPVYLAVLRSNRPQNRSQEDKSQKIKRVFTYRKTRRSFTGPTASPEGANTEFSPSFALQRTISWRNSRIRSRFPMNPLFHEILAPGIRSCLALDISSDLDRPPSVGAKSTTYCTETERRDKLISWRAI